MNAVERVLTQIQARRVRDGEWRAKCPAHDGKSDGSLSIKDAGDRVLVHCHAGCELRDILNALGMKSAAELFDSIRTAPDPALQRRARALRGLQAWSERFLVAVCSTLRHLDQEIRFATTTIQAIEDGVFQRDPQVENDCWNLLGKCILTKQLAEEYFEILNGDDLQAKLDLWRKAAK